MKELSIEEKARRYDEAIEIANSKWHHKNKPCIVDIVEIFPELKSEDERMRNAAINACKYMVDNFENSTKEYEDAIAWLEKQSEQKPKFRVGDTIKCKYDDRQFTIKSVDLDKGIYTYTQEGCGNDIDYADEEFELVEPKPAWSEEDENIKQSIINILTKQGFQTQVNWLKSIKDRVQPQPKQECCKEDKLVLTNTIALIQGYKESLYDDEFCVENCDYCLNWLKSLRTQSTWKPSDEQMKAIRLARSFVTDDFDEHPALSEILVELEEQLKKLREE